MSQVAAMAGVTPGQSEAVSQHCRLPFERSAFGVQIYPEDLELWLVALRHGQSSEETI